MKIAVRQDPRRLRKAAYPEIGDQLDALWKFIASLPPGQPLPAEVADMLDKIQAVKQRFPMRSVTKD